MKPVKTALITWALLLMVVVSVLPDEPRKNEAYDLTAVLKTALKNHPSLRRVGAQVDAARAQLEQAKSGYAPRLGATLGYSRLQDDPSFSMSPFGTVVFGETTNGQAALTLQVPVFTGGKLEGTNRQARAGVVASESLLQRQRQKVALDATVAYYSVLRASNLMRVAEDQLKALIAQRDAIGRMLQQGVTTRIDLLRSQTAVSSAQEGLTRAKNGEAVATAALANAMGIPQNPLLKTAQVDSLRIELPPDVRSAINQALLQRPELKQMDANHKSAMAGVQVAKSNLRPSLAAYAQYDAKRPTFMPETGKWSAGVALTMNVFDGGGTAAEVARARAEVAQVEAAKDELRNGIELQVTQSFLNVQSAGERLKTTEEGVATAEEGMRLVRLGYQNGVNTITDFLTAQAELTKALNDRVVALFDLRVAESELGFALGLGR